MLYNEPNQFDIHQYKPNSFIVYHTTAYVCVSVYLNSFFFSIYWIFFSCISSTLKYHSLAADSFYPSEWYCGGNSSQPALTVAVDQATFPISNARVHLSVYACRLCKCIRVRPNGEKTAVSSCSALIVLSRRLSSSRSSSRKDQFLCSCKFSVWF